MKFVYQIGDVPLYGNLVSSDGNVSLNEDRSWAIKETEFTGTGTKFNFLPLGRRIPETTSIEIEGTLVSTNYQGFLHTLSRLKTLGGLRDIPLITFEVQQPTLTTEPIRWLVTYGTITDINDTSEYGDNINGMFEKKLSLKMTISPVWRPMLRYYWEYRPIYTMIPPLFITENYQAGTDTIFAQPNKMSGIQPNNYFQIWPATYSDLSTEAWASIYQENGGFGFDYVSFQTFYFNAAAERWSAPPTAKYVATSLLPQGTLHIETTNAYTTFVAELDLESLNLQLVNRGYFGLYVSDEIFFGNTDPFCSFIRRNGAIIADFVPQWVYTGLYPGEVTSGYNKVNVFGLNTTGKFAANILYGSF